MRRFYLPQLSVAIGDLIDLPTEVVRHIVTVLRLPSGSYFELFDGKGSLATCTLTSGKKQARVDQLQRLEPPEFNIELIQGLAKGEKLDLILQKGTELGLAKFILTATERSVVKLTENKKKSRCDRWLKIVQEACRQSGQPFVPELETSNKFTTALERSQGDLKLMLWEEANTPLRQILPSARPKKISLLVGPEGGISAEEAGQAQAAGFQPVLLGPRILRTETAGLAILSILQYVYGDFDSDNKSSFSSITHGKELS